ncbi:hypothetical protein [Mucilaginibacter terrae]|nr:hypothetical protein [Mucilaginibacter terrae]
MSLTLYPYSTVITFLWPYQQRLYFKEKTKVYNIKGTNAAGDTSRTT